ncbi:MAG: LamG domain-containing protein [Ferruginibacter sp.]|nr:LamG domain-containing protein [Ferruginibacter sp.]
MTQTKTILALAIVLTTISTSCKKKDPPVDIPLPPIGGFNNSNEVAAANLKAHWPFDGNLNERISTTAATTSLRSTFLAGIKGQAVRLDSGYILYPTIAALNSDIGSFTTSTWIFTQNQGAGTRPTGVFALTLGANRQADWNDGPILLSLENGRPTSYNDTLVLKSNIATTKAGSLLKGDNINDFGVRETDFKTVKEANKWVHVVTRWDGAGSFIDIFANGILVSNNNFRFRQAGGIGFGAMTLPAATNTQVLFGGYPNTTNGFPLSPLQGFQGLYRGNIDEARFYNKALSLSEISALYELEKVGR